MQAIKINFGIKTPINMKTIKPLNINNLRILDSNVISGGTFEQRTIEDLKKIKTSGIEMVVDFRADSAGLLKTKCDKIGLKYFNFPLDNVLTLDNTKYFSRSKDNKIEVTNYFIKKLKQFFHIMNEKKSYVGCQYGIDRTNVGLSLNYLLNSKTKQNAPEILTWPGDRKKSIINKNTKIVKKILKAMTDEQKKALGLSVKNNDYTNMQAEKLVKKNKLHIDTSI